MPKNEYLRSMNIWVVSAKLQTELIMKLSLRLFNVWVMVAGSLVMVYRNLSLLTSIQMFILLWHSISHCWLLRTSIRNATVMSFNTNLITAIFQINLVFIWKYKYKTLSQLVSFLVATQIAILCACTVSIIYFACKISYSDAHWTSFSMSIS